MLNTMEILNILKTPELSTEGAPCLVVDKHPSISVLHALTQYRA